MAAGRSEVSATFGDMSMSRLRKLRAWCLTLALIPSGALAQQTGSVNGTVIDQERQRPLPGVQIFIAGTNRGALTNMQGRYVIPNVPPGPQTVRAQLIGYSQGEQTVTVLPDGSVSADFSLDPSAVELDAVVVNAVTGQAERKRELGTNTANINVDQIERAPITKLADVLTGRAAGVNLQGVAGTTGTSQRIRIRGANSLSLDNDPLIYVDGVQFSNNKGGIGVGGQDFSRLNDLNPEDIAEVEVLKGPAAAALYGTAAANGVILITTKRGRSGAPQWRAYAEVGTLEDRSDYPANFLAYQIEDESQPLFTDEGVFNTDAYAACTNVEAATTDEETGQPVCVQDAFVSFSPLENSRLSPFSTGERQKYGLSVSGGSDQITYFLSVDTEDETGVIDYNTLTKLNLRANLGARITEKLDVQVTSGYVNSDLALNQNDNSIFSPILNGLAGLPVLLPPEVDERSVAGQRPSFGFGYNLEDLRNLVTFQEVDRFTVGLNTTYRPLAWLAANANVGMDYFNRHDFETLQPARLPIGGEYDIGYRNSIRNNSYLYTGTGSATATFNLMPELVSTSTVGAQYQRDLFENTSCSGAGIVEGTRSCGAASSLFEVDEDFSEIITIGGFGRQQFAYKDRIFFAASVRGDDNSTFGREFGFIYYPSVQLSWVMSEEPWFPRTSAVSNLRLRTAYGESGLRPDFREAVTLFAPVAVRAGGEELSAVTLSRVGDPELEPEKTREYELGFDAGLFDERLSAEFTYYNKKSRDALIERDLAPSFGLTGDDTDLGSLFTNLGSIRNSGIELGLDARVINTSRAALNLRLAATTLANEITELGAGVAPIPINGGVQRFQEGYSAGGFFQAPYTYRDENGDGLLSVDEVQIDSTRFLVVPGEEGGRDTLNVAYLGPTLPTSTQSLSADLTLFSWVTISALFERRAGNKQWNFTESFRCGRGYALRDLAQAGCEAIAGPNVSLDDQAAFIAKRFYGTETGYIEDADFIKWREMSVTLGVPPVLASRFRALEGASLTLSGRNLYTWTGYSGLDPEINETGGSSTATGGGFLQNEFNTQPPVRYLTARLNLTF